VNQTFAAARLFCSLGVNERGHASATRGHSAAQPGETHKGIAVRRPISADSDTAKGYVSWLVIEWTMRKDAAIAALRAHESELRRAGVAHLYLFGSVARDEARPGSDVDLFLDIGDPRFSLIELVDVKESIDLILGIETDVMTRASLHPMLKEQIEAEAVCVF
jgi:uncharacterized protein